MIQSKTETILTDRPLMTNQNSFKCPEQNGYYSILNSCQNFWQCSNGHAYLQTCPGDLVFNVEKLTCDYRTETSCFDVELLEKISDKSSIRLLGKIKELTNNRIKVLYSTWFETLFRFIIKSVKI
jgi:hypothetical protein